MYGLKIAGRDQVSFGLIPVLMVVKIIWSTVKNEAKVFSLPLLFLHTSQEVFVYISIHRVAQNLHHTRCCHT